MVQGPAPGPQCQGFKGKLELMAVVSQAMAEMWLPGGPGPAWAERIESVARNK